MQTRVVAIAVALVALCLAHGALADDSSMLDWLSAEFGTVYTPEYIERRSYVDFFGFPCTQLLGNDGPIGCSTSSHGSSGWLYPVLDAAALDALVASPPLSAIVPVIAASLFTPTNFERMNDACHLHGVLVLDGEGPPEGFSPAEKNPNKRFGLYPDSDMVWNPLGSGWSYEQLPVPVFALNYDNSQGVAEYANANVESSRFPRYAVRLMDWMYSRKDEDVETCLRRGNCAPLGGKNIWSLLDPLDKQKELVLVTAALDSNAFFHDLAKGADAGISGAVALLSTIQTLSQVDRSAWTKQPLFVLFDGEAWGYIGSKAWVQDLVGFECLTDSGSHCATPYRSDLHFQDVHFDKISKVLELSQLGRPATSDGKTQIYGHFDSEAGNATSIITSLQSASDGTYVSVNTAPAGQELPPSSLMSFLLEDRSLEGLVLAEHEAEYLNPYYHSQFDTMDKNEIDVQAVCDIATVVARAVASLASDGADIPEVQADCPTIAALYQCFTLSLDCDLVEQLYQDLEISGTLPPPTSYVSVYRSSSETGSFVRDWIRNTTASVRLPLDCQTSNNCTSDAPVCLQSQCIGGYNTYYHDALSPAFDYSSETRVYGIVNASPFLPQWTEA